MKKTKFYVSSGGYNEIILAEDSTKAVEAFLVRVTEKDEEAAFGLITHVSELGFEIESDSRGHDDDLFFNTEMQMKKLGML